MAESNASKFSSKITSDGTIGQGGLAAGVGDTDWQAVQTTSFTAESGKGYFVDTTSGAITVTLPSSPSIGDKIAIKDYAANFGTNSLTIARNGNNIQGVANNSLISTNRASLTLVYVDATKGWLYAVESNVASLGNYTSATGGTVTTSGDFKIHTFTGDGCFVVSNVGFGGVDYLVVAGGGGGGGTPQGGNNRAGGGGAGGYRTTFPSPDCNAGAFPISVTTYPITVGGGGTGTFGTPTNGSNSVFSTITSAGGGFGGYQEGPPSPPPGAAGNGGSGGGGSSSNNCAGLGNTPPVSPPQGNPGGNSSGYNGYGGGGGGAGEAGNTDVDAGGGDGLANSITGSSVTYAGGGGGLFQPGGDGGGGNSAPGPSGPNPGCAGAANTGGGGGAGYGSPATPPGTPGGAGGSGIVIIRYKYQ